MKMDWYCYIGFKVWRVKRIKFTFSDNWVSCDSQCFQIIRRITFIKKIYKKRENIYEMKFTGIRCILRRGNFN